MGYNTDFEGKISISPPAPASLVERVNAFCDVEHRSLDGFGHDRGFPGIHCNWWVSADGTSIGWSGNEKSYEMEAWLPIIIRKFFFDGMYKLNGVLRARGEDFNDMWRIVCKDNVVSSPRGWGEGY